MEKMFQLETTGKTGRDEGGWVCLIGDESWMVGEEVGCREKGCGSGQCEGGGGGCYCRIGM